MARKNNTVNTETMTNAENALAHLCSALAEEFGDQKEWALGSTLGALLDNWSWNVDQKAEKILETTAAVKDMLDPYIIEEDANTGGTRSVNLPDILEIKVERKVAFIESLEEQSLAYQGLIQVAAERFVHYTGKTWKRRSTTKTHLNPDRLARFTS